MRCAFRVDASTWIGSGHVVRCLTLAEELRRRGADTLFLCRDFPGNLCLQIQDRGHEVCRLSAPADAVFSEAVSHRSWLAVSPEQDAKETRQELNNRGDWDWLVIDHYGIDRNWETVLRGGVRQIMVIDDLADRPHDCDILLDQNLYSDPERRYQGLIPDGCRTLLGPKYALLRPEFGQERARLRQRDGRVERLMIFLGGFDPGNETEKVLRAFIATGLKDILVEVVVGAGNPNRIRIENLCRDLPNVNFHCQVDNMARLMVASDLSVGAGGTSTWERCTLGLPSLVMSLADNQVELARWGGEQGLFFYLGCSKVLTSERLIDALRLFCSSPESLRGFSNKGLATADGRGTQRVAAQLFPPAIHLREARAEDCDSVLQWRNAAETRRHIFNAEIISPEAHRAWYQKTLEDPARVLLIGESQKQSVGVLRYDFSGDEALVSVYLVPGVHGQGMGTQLIRKGSDWLLENRPEIRIVNAEILSENHASLGAFKQAGYQDHHLMLRKVLP